MYERLTEATKTLCAVRDSISPAEHPIAYRALFSIQMAFYSGRTVEECVELLLAYEREMKSGKYDSDILKRAAQKSIGRLSVELSGK